MNQDNVLNSLPPFFISQRVVAVKNHSQGDFRMGDKFTVAGIRKGDCQCGGWLVSVGIKSEIDMRCIRCGTVGIPNVDGLAWYGAVCFAPIEENFASISYSRVMEEEGKLVSSN